MVFRIVPSLMFISQCHYVPPHARYDILDGIENLLISPTLMQSLVEIFVYIPRMKIKRLFLVSEVYTFRKTNKKKKTRTLYNYSLYFVVSHLYKCYAKIIVTLYLFA